MNTLFIHLAGRSGVDFHIDSDVFSYTNKKNGQWGRGKNWENEKVCVYSFTAYSLCGCRERHVHMWVTQFIKDACETQAMPDPAHNNLELE